MARHEHLREDLLRDAKALAPRVQLIVPRRQVAENGATVESNGHEVFAGWRGDALSLFFDQDPVYHFDATGGLRRAYLDGSLVKAVAGRLVRLTRERTQGSVVLVRHELDAAEQAALLGEMGRWLNQLSLALDGGLFSMVGQIPNQGDAVARLRAWLLQHPEPRAGDRPNVA